MRRRIFTVASGTSPIIITNPIFDSSVVLGGSKHFAKRAISQPDRLLASFLGPFSYLFEIDDFHRRVRLAGIYIIAVFLERLSVFRVRDELLGEKSTAPLFVTFLSR